MNNIFESDSTAASLRLLADQIDADSQPDFIVIFGSGNQDFTYAKKDNENPFLLVGAMEHIKAEIINNE